MQLATLCQGIDGLKLVKPDSVSHISELHHEVSSIILDSRKAHPGALFAALQGTQVHGIQFAEKALQLGSQILLTDTKVAETTSGFDVVISSDDVRNALGRMAARLYRPQPERMVAVTGTNGKTSVASFYRQIMQKNGFAAAQIGTTGVIANRTIQTDTLTSPDVVTLHELLHDLDKEGISTVALEASSHGLDQQRMAGVKFQALGFTSFSQDHLDYHETMQAYLDAKLKLFNDFGGPDVTVAINTNIEVYDQILKAAENTGCKILRVGNGNAEIDLIKRKPVGYTQELSVKILGTSHTILLPLVGKFQVDNVLIAVGLAIGSGLPAAAAIASLQDISGATGRLEFVGQTPKGAGAVIDYAHTPDAMENALKSLREVTKRNIHVVFGAGGDRDPLKRPLMGEAAHQYADKIWVTDDNPRGEEPGDIREMVLQGCPNAKNIEGRRAAIEAALCAAEEGDTILIAGKGHETYQEIAGVKHDFSDHLVVQNWLLAQSAQ